MPLTAYAVHVRQGSWAGAELAPCMLASPTSLVAPRDEDRRLVAAAIQEQPGAFDRLWAHVHPVIERSLDKVLSKWPEVAAERDDFRQNLRMHLVANDFVVLRSFRGESALTTWMRTVASRFFYRQATRTNKKRACEVGDVKLEVAPSEQPSVEAKLHRAQQRSAVQSALTDCSVQERLLFGLLFEQGLSADAASKVLGIKASGVRMRKKRLLAKLEKRLSEVWP